MLNLLRKLWRDDEAQDIAEYALMLAVILIIVIVTVQAIGKNAASIFSQVADSLSTEGAGGGGTP